jgi:hypothetical protein
VQEYPTTELGDGADLDEGSTLDNSKSAVGTKADVQQRASAFGIFTTIELIRMRVRTQTWLGDIVRAAFDPERKFLTASPVGYSEREQWPTALMPTLKHLSEPVLGYAIHTNRELGFMLRGSKPLAVFSDAYGQFPAAVLRYLRIFDRYVAEGAFVKCDYVELRGKPPVPLHVILYATPNEEWRIEAMLELREQMGMGAWTAEHERAEGELLGYTGWQNDIWISRRFSKPA